MMLFVISLLLSLLSTPALSDKKCPRYIANEPVADLDAPALSITTRPAAVLRKSYVSVNGNLYVITDGPVGTKKKPQLDAKKIPVLLHGTPIKMHGIAMAQKGAVDVLVGFAGEPESRIPYFAFESKMGTEFSALGLPTPHQENGFISLQILALDNDNYAVFLMASSGTLYRSVIKYQESESKFSEGWIEIAKFDPGPFLVFSGGIAGFTGRHLELLNDKGHKAVVGQRISKNSRPVAITGYITPSREIKIYVATEGEKDPFRSRLWSWSSEMPDSLQETDIDLSKDEWIVAIAAEMQPISKMGSVVVGRESLEIGTVKMANGKKDARYRVWTQTSTGLRRAQWNSSGEPVAENTKETPSPMGPPLPPDVAATESP